MNFNFLIIFMCLVLITGCGVKAAPVKYPETAVDSYIQNYTGNDPTPEEIERANRNKEALEAAKKQETEKPAPSLIPAP